MDSAEQVSLSGSTGARVSPTRHTLATFMVRIVAIAIVLDLLCRSAAIAQAAGSSWAVRGDTAGAPRGCGSADALAAISGWFAAFNNADTAGLRRFTAKKASFLVFSAGKFTPEGVHVRIESVSQLVQFARKRAEYHDRLTLEGVRFYGWRGGRLGFMPYFVRAATDLGPRALPGVGKAEYICGQGISILNLAPRPPGDPGLSLRVAKPLRGERPV